MSDTTFHWTEITAPPAYGDPATLALIAECLAGDETAFTLLYQAHASIVYRLAYSVLQHKEDAEEVLQDSFDYAFRRLRQYNPNKSAFKTWLYQITVSRCRNKRRRKWLPSLPLNMLGEHVTPKDTHPLPDEQLMLDDQQVTVWQALSQLSPKLRETAVLRYYDGLSYQEIGQILGIPAKTAESRMRLAHKALKQLLSGLDF